jgi:hypothetical protein
LNILILSVFLREIKMKELFSIINVKLFAISLIALVIGYVLLAQGPANNPLSKSVAPIILVLSYCVLIPLSIVFSGKHKGSSAQDKKGV